MRYISATRAQKLIFLVVQRGGGGGCMFCHFEGFQTLFQNLCNFVFKIAIQLKLIELINTIPKSDTTDNFFFQNVFGYDGSAHSNRKRMFGYYGLNFVLY